MNSYNSYVIIAVVQEKYDKEELKIERTFSSNDIDENDSFISSDTGVFTENTNKKSKGSVRNNCFFIK